MFKTQEEWANHFNELGALWIHDGNPKRPHALLTSGSHSSGFFNATLVAELPQVLSEACADLIVPSFDSWDSVPSRVVGSAMGAVTIAHEIARRLSIQFRRSVRSGYTEPSEGPNGKEMLMKRFRVDAEQKVLVVEDVLTSGATTTKTIAELEARGAKVLDFIPVLVNRSGMKELGGRRIVALIERPMPIWRPEACLLCSGGSHAVRPKENWERLNAEY